MSITFGQGSLSIMDESQEWKELGHISLDELVLGFDGTSDGEMVAAIQATPTESFSFNLIDFDREALELYFGSAPEVEPTHAIYFTYEDDWPEPRHPRKRWWLMGKRYRRECRRWQREHKAWRRGKDKKRTIGIYIPRARIDINQKEN